MTTLTQLKAAAEDRGMGNHNCGFCGGVVSILSRCNTCDQICGERYTPSIQMKRYAEATNSTKR